MNKIIRVMCLPWCIPIVPLSAATQARFADTHADEIQTLLDEQFGSGQAGIVVGLIDKQGSHVFSAGSLGDGTNRPVDGDSIFEICSVTKVFTAVLLLDAIRRGEVQLDDPVAKYLPEGVTVPARDGKGISLAHLAAQESGLPFNPEMAPGRDASTDAILAEDLYRFLSGYELSTVPGSGFVYSNTGFALLGNALERKTGLAYETLLINRICRPLSMEDTGIALTEEQRRRLTRGRNREGKAAPYLALKVMGPAGAVLSTANDMVTFLSAALGFTPTPLTPLIEETLVVRHRNQPRYGTTAMPWFDEGIYCPPGSEILAHGGGSRGYRSFLGVDTKKRRGVVVLTNQTTFNPMGIGWTLLQGFPLTAGNVTNWVREVVGLGVALGEDEETGAILITQVFPDSPAGKAGLSGRFKILKINDIAVQGKSLRECLDLMVGPLGTKVRLELVSKQDDEAKTVELTKERFLTLHG